jgi:DNA-binding MurR/RpiR family transcriptional regulator
MTEQHIEKLLKGKRLTPAHRQIVQTLLAHSGEIGFMSITELAKLANVSQPSMTRFATALGFDSYTELRNFFRELATKPDSPLKKHAAKDNKYLSAIAEEATNVAALGKSFENVQQVEALGQMLANSRPLPVLGLRASAGLAEQFAYFAAKLHPDVRSLLHGGSMIEDRLEQAALAGATCLLAFALPLYPHETINAMKFARGLGMKVIAVADSTFRYQSDAADFALSTYVHSSLVFDSSAASAVLVSILLDAMCDAVPGAAQRLEDRDRSSIERKVFVRRSLKR